MSVLFGVCLSHKAIFIYISSIKWKISNLDLCVSCLGVELAQSALEGTDCAHCDQLPLRMLHSCLALFDESGQDEACKGPWKGRSRPFLSSQLWAPVLSLRIRKSAQRLLPSWVKARCWLYLALRRWILSASRQRIWWRLWLVPWPNLTLIGQPRSRKHGFRDCEFCVRMKDFSMKIFSPQRLRDCEFCARTKDFPMQISWLWILR